jgi:alternate signal-mediated exported protein
MKKFNMKKTTTAAVAATVGAVLLLGGAGTLAYWSDTETSANQTISSGNLDLETINSGAWKLQHVVGDKVTSKVDYVVPTTTVPGTPIVPGDVLTTTVNVPVKLLGTNMKARLDVTDAKAVAVDELKKKMSEALTVNVESINGVTITKDANGVKKDSVELTPGSVTNNSVPVVISVTFPWTTDTTQPVTSNTVTTALQSATFSAKYTLTQVEAGVAPTPVK